MGWDEVGFVKASQVRHEILKRLSQKPASPKDLTRDLDLHFPQVSTALSDLSEKGLVECLTSGRVKGKIYAVTQSGTQVLEQL